MKFKVGDYVVGNDRSKKDFMRMRKGRMLLGKVISILGAENGVRIEIIESTNKDDIGTEWTTNELHCFDLIVKDPFEALLRGHITEKEYVERVANA